MKKPQLPEVPVHQKGTKRIHFTLTEEQIRAADLIAEDMKRRGEAYATASGAVGLALATEAARRKLPGYADPEPYTPTKPHSH